MDVPTATLLRPELTELASPRAPFINVMLFTSVRAEMTCAVPVTPAFWLSPQVAAFVFNSAVVIGR
jgi:hypothetical protein